MGDIVKLQNISLNYHSPQGETEAIGDVSFNVSEGEFLSIVGPSGCGKSTLLSVISGLIKPSQGNVLIKDLPVAENSVSLGYMLQRDHLFEWRSILQNVCLGLEIQGKLTAENIRFAKELLYQYGLGGFIKHHPSELSGGMRQRAALIRTLVLQPEILLLDEPFSALDYQTRLQVSDEIGTIIRNEKKTAILVTHDISEAVSLSDRVVVLSKRPSVVKDIHEIDLEIPDRTPMKAREAPKFRYYFNSIWKELDKNG